MAIFAFLSWADVLSCISSCFCSQSSVAISPIQLQHRGTATWINPLLDQYFSGFLVGGLVAIKFYFPIHIGLRLSSQLTNSYFSEGFKPPTSFSLSLDSSCFGIKKCDVFALRKCSKHLVIHPSSGTIINPSHCKPVSRKSRNIGGSKSRIASEVMTIDHIGFQNFPNLLTFCWILQEILSRNVSQRVVFPSLKRRSSAIPLMPGATHWRRRCRTQTDVTFCENGDWMIHSQYIYIYIYIYIFRMIY